MALLAAIRQKVEDWRDLLAPKIVSRQNAYYAIHGHYWQGIITPASVPVDAADTDPDLARHPTDQAATWADFLSTDAPAKFPCSLRIDVYRGPDGDGYTVTAYVISQAGTYTRTWNVGPETWRAVTWREVA